MNELTAFTAGLLVALFAAMSAYYREKAIHHRRTIEKLRREYNLSDADIEAVKQ